jgi:hypothetical protein
MAPTLTTAFPCLYPEPLICLPKIHFIIVSYIESEFEVKGWAYICSCTEKNKDQFVPSATRHFEYITLVI